MTDPYLLACEKLGKTPRPELTDITDSESVHEDFAHRLRTCIAAENAIPQEDGTVIEWKPAYDGTEDHYFPWFKKDKSGPGWSYCGNVSRGTDTGVGPRLEYRSYDIMITAVKKLNHLYVGYFNN
jgi:hypothetical protein